MTSPVPTVRPLGPGVFTVGAAGSSIDFAVRCTAAKIVPKVDQADDVPLLSGGTEAGDRTYTAGIEATVYQDDLQIGGLIDFSWSHAGEQVPFTFTPYAGTNARSVAGQLIVDPLEIGGDVKKKNTADVKWGCVGFPTLVDDLS